MLQGLMSSKGGTSAGGVTGDVTGSELAEVCQQSHVSVMGRNMERAMDQCKKKFVENFERGFDECRDFSQEVGSFFRRE